MIVGTAGHIDHGKTTLVRALTGVDTDRLPEEKRRGISIDLGYAFLDVPGAHQRIGFVDVPGHERLVHTMLAGATGIDFALLVVAADDGVMPQTREHLAVLSLLGLSRGAVVVTKADSVDAARVHAVLDEVAALLRATALQGAPVLAVSAHGGHGLPELKSLLFAAALGLPARGGAAAAFRLAVDRTFTLDGVGTVATGTVHAGRVAVGDALCLVPGDREMRVRSLHAQNRPVMLATAGQRCAVALAGVAKDDLARGQWLVSSEVAVATDRLDAWLTLWHAEDKPLRSGTPVQVHVGSAGVAGTVAVLDGEALAPGMTARVQLVLQQPVGAWHGDRVVLRDICASRTLAGGMVLDPFAPQRYRRTPQRLASLDAQRSTTPAERLAGLLGQAAHGLELQRWRRAEGLARDMQPELPPQTLTASVDAGAVQWALTAAAADSIDEAVVRALRAYHERHHEEIGPDAGRLRRLACPKLPEPLWRSLLSRALAAGRVARRGAFVHLPEHGAALSASDLRIAQKVRVPLEQAGFEGAWVRDLARDAQEPEAMMRTTLVRLAQRGELHQVVRDLFYPPRTIQRLAMLVRQHGANDGREVTAAGFRDATSLGRKRAIQILEYFDRVGLLRRVGDAHKLRSDTALFEEPV